MLQTQLLLLQALLVLVYARLLVLAEVQMLSLIAVCSACSYYTCDPVRWCPKICQRSVVEVA